nr:putative disease resistance protein [Quercus suber]
MPLDVAGAALGAAFGEGFTVLHNTVTDVVSKARMFKPILNRLASTLDRLVPTVDEIKRLSEQLELPERETKRLMEQMEEGEKLVSKCLKIRWWNYVFKVQYSSKLEELDKEIFRFCQLDLQALCTRNTLRTLETVNSINKKMDSFRGVETPRGFGGVSGPEDLTVGLDMPIKELKALLLKEEVKLLLLTAPGGCGKTTLVKMLCQDKEIKGTFKENILFVNVSKTPNVKVIVQILLSHKGLQPMFDIQSDEDAIEQLQQLREHIGSDPILLILDDVWLGSESLPEKIWFKIPNYKIMVTSRTAFPKFKFRYNLNPLNDKDAMTLFRHSASLQDGCSNIPEEDIKKIVKGCGGLPLALKVIGSSLCGRSEEEWHYRLTKWSGGQFFCSSDTELLGQLQKSLEFQDDKVIKDCFMDLGSFPEDQRIHAAALIDMWAELYELDEDGILAIANLQELTTRNLANLVMARKDVSEVKSYYNEDFVTQHDILRELAMHESSQEPIEQRARLIMNISENKLPKWWTEQKQQLINARLLSISTDELFSSSWCNIQASKVEVLVLNFQTKNYTLPKFVEKMDELKVLIVANYGFFHAKISNFQLLGSLLNLKRIRLEKVSNALPNLTEISIDYCIDLVELPVGLCDIFHLRKLSITNCHKLAALPEGIGKLVNLEVLRFRSCTDLSELPESIKGLSKLRILDISDCLSINGSKQSKRETIAHEKKGLDKLSSWIG